MRRADRVPSAIKSDTRLLAQAMIRVHHGAMTIPFLKRPRMIFRHRCAWTIAAAAILFAQQLAVVPAMAGESCNCVANGQRVELGQLFCIKTASGNEFLARCERVLNNTSWKRVQDSCPTVQLKSATDAVPLL